MPMKKRISCKWICRLIGNTKSSFWINEQTSSVGFLGLDETIDRADQLISQISVVMNYLTSDLKQVGEDTQNMQKQNKILA